MLSTYIVKVFLFVTCLTSYLWGVQGQGEPSKLYSVVLIPKKQILNFVGIYFQLREVNYNNNSEVSITDIGIDENSLQCVTDNTYCCGNVDWRMGDWFFPNTSMIKIEGKGESFYRDRVQSRVRLHRRHNATMPTGSFCCEIPDTSNVTQEICIMVGYFESK